MPLKLLTLNIEGSKHLDLVLPLLKKENADVVCLQEVFLEDLNKLKNETMQCGFFPVSTRVEPDKYIEKPKGKWGVVLLTNQQNAGIKSHYYFGRGDSPTFTEPDNNDKVLVYTELEKDGLKYRIGTTHFTWTPDGNPSKHQWETFNSMMKFIKTFDDFILCGDFNAPRGREMFTEFTKHFKDNLPKQVTSTIDPKRHRIKGLELAVDTIFTTKQYKVSNVRVVEGVSDHKAVVGEIKRL